MYGKLTEKIRKGIKLLKGSSKSLRKSSESHQSNSRRLDLNCKSDCNEHQHVGASHRHPAQSPYFKTKSDLSTTEGRVQAIFNNENYKNWLRVVTALRVTCETMAPLVDRVLVDFHLDLRDRFDGESPNELIYVALQHHRQRISKAEVWKRSDVSKWFCPDRGAWELAKKYHHSSIKVIRNLVRKLLQPRSFHQIYMPRGTSAGRDVKSAKSLDITGLLNLFSCFTPFKNYITNLQQVHKVLQIRNCTMHNSRLEFTDAELQQCFVEIRNLLEDEILGQHLAQFPGYDDLMQDLATAKTVQLTTFAVLRSSFEVLEERMLSEQYNDVPSVSAMISNREILKSMRELLSSGEFEFAVDTAEITDKLEHLESLVTMQNAAAEDKISMLFWKANYIQRQVDRLRRPSSDESASEQEANSLNDVISDKKCSKNRTKRNKKRKKANVPSYSTKSSTLRGTPSGGSTMSLKSNKNLSLVKLHTQKQTSFPTLSSQNFKANVSASDSTFASKNSNCSQEGTSESAHVVGNATSFQVNGVTTDIERGDEISSSNATQDEVPGPSGLQSECELTRVSHAGKRKRTTSLGFAEPTKRMLMLGEMSGGFDSGYGGSNGSTDNTSGSSLIGAGGASTTSGGNCNGGYYQALLRSVLQENGKSYQPEYEDNKIGSQFTCTVRFRCQYIVKSKEPKATPQEAEAEVAVEALKRFELQVLDQKNAKPVLEQFCKAAVGQTPHYFCYPVSSHMYMSVVQVHSSYASWLTVDHNKYSLNRNNMASREDILLQVQSINKEGSRSMEDDCIRIALAEANVNIFEVVNSRKALNELCLRQGGTLPILETGCYDKSSGKTVTTMISLALEKLNQSDESDPASMASSNSWESYDNTDVIIANSPHPCYTRDQSEELAAKVLLEKLGIDTGLSAIKSTALPCDHFLRDNAANWGYHPPQFHTFEIQPAISVEGAFLAVASSRAFRDSEHTITASSDKGADSVEEARESAAKKALLMIGYTRTYLLTPSL